MNKETKKILDNFYADKISIEEATKALNMSIKAFLELADGYEYIPTLEEVREANEIVRVAYNHIKSRALQKLEYTARSKIFVPQMISIPVSKSFMGFKTDVRVDMMLYPEIENIKVYRPLGQKTTFWERFAEPSYRKKYGELRQSKNQSDIFISCSYFSEITEQMAYFKGKTKLQFGA